MYKIITIYLIIALNYANACDPMEPLQKELQNIADRSTHHLAVAIVHKGDAFHAFSRRAEENTQFYLGSVTKQMTAYMLLVTLRHKFPQCSLSALLEKKLSDLFPASTFLNSLDRKWVTEISLLDLLTHRSGLNDYLEPFSNGTMEKEALNRPFKAEELLLSISFNPLKPYLYSNSNYLIVGKLIEELHQERFDSLFEMLIKIPAKLDSTSCPISGNYFWLKSAPEYAQLAPNLNNTVFINMANALGAGNGISTIHDLERWGNFLFYSAPASIKEVLLKSYGTDPDGDLLHLGLYTHSTKNLGPLIGHQGGIDSFNSFLGYFPESDRLILFLSNDPLDADACMTLLNSL